MPPTLKIVLTLIVLALIAPASAVAAQRPVYVSDTTLSEVNVIGTNASGGLVSPPTVVPSNAAEGMVVSPDGKTLYVVESSAGVRAFAIGAGGSLTELSGSPFTTTAPVYGVTVTPDGKHLYTAYYGTGANLHAFDIAADGSLTAVPGSPFAYGDNSPFGVASSIDSKTLYVASTGDATVHAYRIAADGSLTPNGAALPTGADPYYVIATPDGKYVYVGNYSGDTVSAFSVAADGALSEIAGSPFPGVNGPYAGMAVSPDSSKLFVTGYSAGNLVPYRIESNGALTPIFAPVGAGTQPNGLAISPDGKRLYSSAGLSADAFAFDVQPDGTLLMNGGPVSLTAGGYSDFQSVAIAPNQPPTAVLSIGTDGNAIRFDASQSTDSDGSVASYAWDFGDGQTQTTTTPTVSHTYAKAGTYNATVTLTDDEGCSTKQIYSGQATLCNGSGVATKSAELDAGVDAKVKAKGSQKQKGSLKIAVDVTSAENVKVVASGSASFKGVKDKIALKKVKTTAEAGKKKKLKLKAKKKDQGKAVVGFKGKAKIKVKLTDEAGNTLTKNVNVKLK